MAVETKRGCGYRKVDGMYLVCSPMGFECDRLPFELTVCPCCGEGIKFSRGFTWILPVRLFGGNHSVSYDCGCLELCPVCYPRTHFKVDEGAEHKKAGLLWVGEKHYSVESFRAEAATQGISKRIASIPRGFKVGETWVFLAHKKALHPLETKVKNLGDEMKTEHQPAIFMAFRPQRIEKIVLQSEYDIYGEVIMTCDISFPDQLEFAIERFGKEAVEITQRLSRDVDRGLTLVPVPDDDPDHNPKAKKVDKQMSIDEQSPAIQVDEYQSGQIVQIFDDPVTRKKLEGEAELMTCLTTNYDQEYWRVKFCSDGFVTDRWIHKEQGILSTRVA